LAKFVEDGKPLADGNLEVGGASDPVQLMKIVWDDPNSEFFGEEIFEDRCSVIDSAQKNRLGE
jgi:hypothetical protein